VPDFVKVQETLTRGYMKGFLDGLGIDPAEVCEIRIYPNRMVLVRYIIKEDGTLELDAVGPRTVETYFSIED
jgi:hypothetical protein